MKKFLVLSLLIQFTFSPLAMAKNIGQVDIGELVLPTEVDKLPKKSGSIYFSKSVKNKVLIPTNFWGEVNSSGLHFIPQGTSLVKGLSLAGGPTGDADISNIQVTRSNKKTFKVMEFNLQGGGDKNAHQFALKPGDVVFVKKERFYENRAYYTSLVSVAVTILSGILLYEQVRR